MIHTFNSTKAKDGIRMSSFIYFCHFRIYAKFQSYKTKNETLHKKYGEPSLQNGSEI